MRLIFLSMMTGAPHHTDVRRHQGVGGRRRKRRRRRRISIDLVLAAAGGLNASHGGRYHQI
jgi:hypothetical protein